MTKTLLTAYESLCQTPSKGAYFPLIQRNEQANDDIHPLSSSNPAQIQGDFNTPW